MQLEENTKKVAKAREFLKAKEKEKSELDANYKQLRTEHDKMQALEHKIGNF